MKKNLPIKLKISLFSLFVLFFIFLFLPKPTYAGCSETSCDYTPECSLWQKIWGLKWGCDKWVGECGSGSCAITHRYYIDWCYYCGNPGYWQIWGSGCKYDSDCGGYCACTDWTDVYCGGPYCSSAKMWQTRHCESDPPDRCDDLGYDTNQCVSSSSCQATPTPTPTPTSSPSCYTSGTSCAAQGGRCGNYNSSNCSGTVRTGLCPGGSDCVCCIPSSTICGDIGGTYCVHSGTSCPSGYNNLGPTSDCTACCGPSGGGPTPTPRPGGPTPTPAPPGGGSITIC